MFRFLDLKAFGPICGSSTCVKDVVDKFEDIEGGKKGRKKRTKEDESEHEMYVNDIDLDDKFYFLCNQI